MPRNDPHCFIILLHLLRTHTHDVVCIPTTWLFLYHEHDTKLGVYWSGESENITHWLDAFWWRGAEISDLVCVHRHFSSPPTRSNNIAHPWEHQCWYGIDWVGYNNAGLIAQAATCTSIHSHHPYRDQGNPYCSSGGRRIKSAGVQFKSSSHL